LGVCFALVAVASAIWPDSKVLTSQAVAALAFCLRSSAVRIASFLGNHVLHVFAVCSRKQVIGIAATWHIAVVTNLLAWRYIANKVLE